MTKKVQLKWNEDRTNTLVSIVGATDPVTKTLVEEAAVSLDVSPRSIASKLRNMGRTVVAAEAAGKSYTDEQEKEITNFLNANPNTYTYAEIASKVLNGDKNARQIQGKILSMELYDLVKATEQVAKAKTFTDAEETKLLGFLRTTPAMFIEDIAKAMGREVNQIRGKVLSLIKVHADVSIPKKKEYVTKKEDLFSALGDVSNLTVEDIADKIDKSVRGVKTILSHRGVDCDNYKGEARRAKLDEAKASA